MSTHLRVGVVFGGVSVEHEVSVISSLQALAALDRRRYEPIPIYISKQGIWLTGPELSSLEVFQDLEHVHRHGVVVVPEQRATGGIDLVEMQPRRWARPRRFGVDVMFLGLHGAEGENGSLQGLCETLNIPYTGSSVCGSALGMDKVLSKMVCREQGIDVVDFVAFRESEWADREEAWLDRCEQAIGYPMIVKPARLGSSVGIARADTRTELDAAIEEALRFDDKVIVEQGIVALREINCSVLGDPSEARASVLEQPVRSEGEALLTFEEKYQRGDGGGKQSGGKSGTGAAGMASLDRIIPAPMSAQRTAAIQALAVRIFQLFECGGVARIDFMIDEATDRLYFNEINTIPGSFSFYLWEPSGLSFGDLTHQLIEVALKQHRLKNSRVRSYETNLLSQKSLKGLKGAKG